MSDASRRASRLEHLERLEAALYGGAALGILSGVYVAGLASAPEHARTLDFFSTSAQILPVTLLVLVIEGRFFGALDFPKPQTAVEWIGLSTTVLNVVVVLAAMILGEFAALHPLATGEPKDGDAARVYGAMAVGFAAICLIVVLGRLRPRARS